MGNQPVSYLYLSKGRILLLSNTLDNGEHHHHALQISMALEDRPYLITHPGGTDCAELSIIEPNYMHKINVVDTWHLLILIDAETDAARQIQERYLQLTNIATPKQVDIDYCRQRMQHFVHNAQPIEEIDSAINDVVTRLTGPVLQQPYKDERIDKVIKLIHQAGGQVIRVNSLARAVGLSPSRLSHLFKDVTDIPIKRYLLWYKLCQTGFKVCAGMSFTTAATEAGFADAAHYSRTFRKMFGMKPSQILRENASVKIISDISL
ncbi:MAG: helix-turn-helix domain-containing protein [Pseudomonadales bacterium]